MRPNGGGKSGGRGLEPVEGGRGLLPVPVHLYKGQPLYTPLYTDIASPIFGLPLPVTCD